MSDMLALIGSITIGGLFLLSVMNFYGGLIDHSQEKTFELISQYNTSSYMEIIEDDFRKLGSGVPMGTSPIISNPDSSDITFLADLDNDGDAETVRYYTNTPADVATTPNPEDVVLFRVVDGSNTIDQPGGVVSFDVRLRNWLGTTTADFADVRMIDITLYVESNFSHDGDYPRSLWQKRLTPANLAKSNSVNIP